MGAAGGATPVRDSLGINTADSEGQALVAMTISAKQQQREEAMRLQEIRRDVSGCRGCRSGCATHNKPGVGL